MGQRLDRPITTTSNNQVPNASSDQGSATTRTSQANANHLASSVSDLSNASAASSSFNNSSSNNRSSELIASGQHASESFIRFLQSRQNCKSSTGAVNASNFRLFNLTSSNNDYDSDVSSDEDTSTTDYNSFAHALPLFMGFRDLKCLVCSKAIAADDLETHLASCLMRPKNIYNDDVLTEDRDECIICLENLEKGQKIARLACLCIYHKHCIDAWLRVNPSCPAHPVN